MKILIIRHGESYKNLNGEWDGCLTDFGRSQILKTMSQYHDLRPVMIYSSPYGRCIQSAEVVASCEDYKILPQIDHRIKEYEYARQSIIEDLVSFVKDLKNHTIYNNDDSDCVIVVTHGTPALILANILNNHPTWDVIPAWKDQINCGDSILIEMKNKKSYIYEYPMHCITCDAMVYNDKDEILLVKKTSGQFAGQWALPGGHLDENELLEDCALRELQEECGLKYVGSRRYKPIPRVCDAIDRDPRGRKIDHVFSYKYRDFAHCDRIQDGECGESKFFSFDEIKNMNLVVDHKRIILEPLYA